MSRTNADLVVEAHTPKDDVEFLEESGDKLKRSHIYSYISDPTNKQTTSEV